jgi:hypothetical protein
LLGLTDKEMAHVFDVAESTIHKWKIEFPLFSESIKAGKENADSEVADRLYQRAMGYEHEEEKIFQYEGEPVRVQTRKHYPPDTQAASLWLRNRQPKRWRDQTDHTVRIESETITPEEQQAAIDELDEKIRRLEEEL